MKATLATLACLLTVGFLSAAEVTGNNTAVVIRKDVVESNTGFQFLCVPVDGLDIANGTQKTVKLSTLLPASTLTAGTKISFVGGTLGEQKASATVSETEGVKSWSTDYDLPGGQIYWLNYQAPVVSQNARRGGSVTTYAQTTGNDTVIFCGQDRARTTVTPVAGQVTAMANDSSKAVTLKELAANPGDLDTILVIQKDSSDYKQYNAFGKKWYGPNGADADAAEIAPGEAFYYFKRK
ncbi:MAG: hypothetical protein IKW38_00595 [Kiritimatiellae bacterium]|nr:hypothetical protein [Kiritimatiellia bacterium]